jgi:hypothetical protein
MIDIWLAMLPDVNIVISVGLLAAIKGPTLAVALANPVGPNA